MFAGALLGFSLIVNVSVLPGAIDLDTPAGIPARLSDQQKEAGLVPLITTATECVSRTVAADPRLGKENFTDLIVESFSTCVAPVRALIDTHDRFFGNGTGERFFMGPYLDGLPTAVSLYVSRKDN